MSEISLDDANQLINYYKQRVSDLEYQALQLQLQLSKTAHTHASTEESVKKESKAAETKLEK